MTTAKLRLEHMLYQIGQYCAFCIDEDCSIYHAARSAVQISPLERLGGDDTFGAACQEGGIFLTELRLTRLRGRKRPAVMEFSVAMAGIVLPAISV